MTLPRERAVYIQLLSYGMCFTAPCPKVNAFEGPVSPTRGTYAYGRATPGLRVILRGWT